MDRLGTVIVTFPAIFTPQTTDSVIYFRVYFLQTLEDITTIYTVQ